MTDSKVEMVLDIREGKVIQRFKDEMREIVYDPENALAVAMHMADLAGEIQGGDKTIPGVTAGKALKDELIERHRMTLTRRVALVMGSIRKDVKRTDGQAAQEIVDIVLKEIF